LYQKNIEYQEEQRKKPNIFDYGIISNAGKRMVESTPRLRKVNTKANLLDNGFSKPMLTKTSHNRNNDALSSFILSKDVKPVNVK